MGKGPIHNGGRFETYTIAFNWKNGHKLVHISEYTPIGGLLKILCFSL